MRGLDALRGLHQDAAEPDPTDQLLQVAKTFQARQQPPQEVAKRQTPDIPQPLREVLAGVPEDEDLDAITRLLGAGARRTGKRLVLELGDAGKVTYTPHAGEFVAKTERGLLTVDAEDAVDVLIRVGLGELTLENRRSAPGADNPQP